MADKYIDSLQWNVEERRKELAEAERRLEEATVMASNHPSAERTTTAWWSDIWVSKDAHQFADRVDAQHIMLCHTYAHAGRAPYILYRAVPTAHGEARLYSSLHVDVVEGFRLHQEKNIPLSDALRSTTPMAEKAHAVYLAKKEEERQQKAKAQAEIDAHKAQPVRVVS